MKGFFLSPVQLLSLLLEALSCADQGVQLSTLSCLEPVLVDPPPALIQQLEALVSRLLALTSSPAMVSEILDCRWHMFMFLCEYPFFFILKCLLVRFESSHR